MKKLIPISAIVLFSCSPSLIHFTEDEYYVDIFDVPGTKNELFLKAHNWMIGTFNNAESVIQHSDKEEGVVIGKYLMHGGTSTSMYGTVDTSVFAIIDIRVKDGKARLEIKPMDWHYDASGLTVYQYSKQKAMSDIAKLADSFFAGMTKESVEF